MRVYAFPKHPPSKDRKFREWITKMKCCVCRGSGTEHDDGMYRVTPSHVLTRGAANGDYFNLVPMCVPCHQAHERRVKSIKKGWQPLAQALTVKYFKETNPGKLNEVIEKYGGDL